MNRPAGAHLRRDRRHRRYRTRGERVMSRNQIPPRSQRPVASYSNYLSAQNAVDYLSDERFPVETVTIVGSGLRFEEHVTGRRGHGRARAIGESAVTGTAIGALLGLSLACSRWSSHWCRASCLPSSACWSVRCSAHCSAGSRTLPAADSVTSHQPAPCGLIATRCSSQRTALTTPCNCSNACRRGADHRTVAAHRRHVATAARQGGVTKL